MGNFDAGFAHAEEVLKKAKTSYDQLLAQSCCVSMYYEGNRDDSLWIVKGLEFLAMHGITNIPSKPSIFHVLKEAIKLQIALKRRSLICVTEFPIATDEASLAEFAISKAFLANAVLAKEEFLVAILAHRMVTTALTRRIATKELAGYIFVLQFVLCKFEQWKAFHTYTITISKLVDRFPDEQEEREMLEGRLGLVHGRLYAQTMYREAIEDYLAIRRGMVRERAL